MPAQRLKKAAKLRVIFNVEGNFYQNIDYDTTFKRKIYVLNCGSAFSIPVAELALCFALDLARGVTKEDRRFRDGKERYFDTGNADTVHFYGSTVGIIGLGNVGKKLRSLLYGFKCRVLVFDPWMPESMIEELDCIPVSLQELLKKSTTIFIVAGVTSENEKMLSKKEFDLIAPGSNVVLVSRAALVDFNEFIEYAERGRFKAATDVFPAEPVPKNHPVRNSDNVILSPHRAGDTPQALKSVGDMVLDDLQLILRGLPPMRMQPAKPETITKLRSVPTAFEKVHE
jgi:phosphoglycerate dehydrogenase-like enzyme